MPSEADESQDEKFGMAGTLREVVRFVRDIPQEIRPAIGLAVIFMFAALVWLVATNKRATGALVFVPVYVFLALCFLTVLVAALQMARVSFRRLRSSVEDEAAKTRTLIEASQRVWPSNALLLGCRIGRRSVTCGVLEVRDAQTMQLPAGRTLKIVQPPVRRDIDPANPALMLDVVAEAMVEAARGALHANPGKVIEGIGIAVPGLVRVSDKKLVQSAAGLPNAMALADEVAERIPRVAQDGLQLFRVNEPRELAELCFIDNDVRCAARHVLSEHLHDVEWESFVCLHVGTGVGSAFVLNGQIYYGSNFWAGEIGHIDLTLEGGLTWSGTGEPLRPVPCSCGNKGSHFETFVNHRGLSGLARVIDREKYEALLQSFVRSQPPSWSEEKVLRKALPELITAVDQLSGLPEPVRELMESSDEYPQYVRGLLDAYIAILTGALSTFVNVLDVKRIVLLGSLVEALHPHKIFDDALRQAMARRLRRSDVERDYAEVDADVWQGAALLARDDQFLDLLRRSA